MRTTTHRTALRRFVVAGIFTTLASGCGGGGSGGGGSSGPAPAPGASSTSTTTTSVTVDTSTTTTMSDAGGAFYIVTFALDEAVTVGSLQLEVDYGDASGEFIGSGGSVSCTSPLSSVGALVVFGDDDSARTLNVAALAIGGFTGPIGLASCEFSAAGPTPLPADFLITVTEANSVDATPIDPIPSLGIANIAPR